MEDQLKKYSDCLSSNGYITEIENGQIKINVMIENINLILICSLSRFFPYEIPQVYIGEESKKALSNIPHIFTDSGICTFVKDKVIPNINNPEKLLLDTISSAISVIRDGIQGKNRHDFIDELLEYWRQKSTTNVQIFVDDLDVAKSIYWCFKGNNIIATENCERLKEIYHAVDCKNVEKYEKGILIPVDGSLMEKIPKTDIDIVDLIEKHSSYKLQYNSFMQKNINKKCLIILNIIVPEGNMLAGWIHMGPGIPNGFRAGHVDLSTAFTMAKDKNGFAVSVENCHHNRLFTRGGDGEKTIWNKVAIIGCGSVGSFLVDALKFYGVEKFILVDNQQLKHENIARHTAGYLCVGMPKVNALNFLLTIHNPNITCQTYNEDAHAVIEDKTDIINSCDVIFSAVASFPVEHHINHLILTDRITKPVIIMWVEPYLIGGHAIIIKEKQDLYKEIFDPNTFEYRSGIVQNSYDYLKREAGCQSIYMPYSGFLLQQFVYRITDHILSKCWNQRGNYLLTWCGKLSEAENYNMKINKEYEKIEDYSLITRRID